MRAHVYQWSTEAASPPSPALLRITPPIPKPLGVFLFTQVLILKWCPVLLVPVTITPPGSVNCRASYLFPQEYKC